MIVLEYKVVGKPTQSKAIDEAIQTTQFVRNKCLWYWMDAPQEEKVNGFYINKYTPQLRSYYKIVANLNSMAVQSAAERAWSAISKLYNCYSLASSCNL